MKAISDKPFRERIAREMHMDVAELPVFRERAPRGVKDAPKGARVFEFELPVKKSRDATPRPGKKTKILAAKGAKQPKEGPFRALLALVPDGSKCWIALGVDDKVVFDAVRSVRDAGTTTLVTREGLAALRETPMLSGGFTSLSEMLGGLASVLGPSRGGWERLPHRGQTPIPWQLTVRSEGPAARIEGRLPRAAVEDIASLVGGFL